jgi:hypothetical protein
VLSDAGGSVELLRRAMPSTPGRPPLELVAGPGAAERPPDARLVLLDRPGEVDPARFGGAPGWPPTIVVVPPGRGTPEPLESEYQRPVPVLPVDVRLGLGAAALTEADHRALRALADRQGDPPEALRERLGADGVQRALRCIRAGEVPTPEALAHRLAQLSGLPQLRHLLVWRVAMPAEARRARYVLAGLAQLAGSGPDGQRLLYQLERFRSAAHELADQELAEALRSGTLRLPDADRQPAERLLGAYGGQPGVRLGLAAEADPEAIRRAAAERMAYWQRLAAHPAMTAPVRDAAEVLVRDCASLLAAPPL